jgi:hypothetical protein
MAKAKFKVLESDNQGYFNIHTQDLTKAEATELRDRLKGYFPHYDYIIEEYTPQPKKYGRYNDKAVDGWEDIHSY